MPLLSRLAVQAARAYGMLVGGSPNNVPVTYLVVAGGGASAREGGGGAGGGGLLTSTTTLSTLNTYSIAVGAGGSYIAGSRGTNGVNSSISGTGLTTITAIGGGAGGSTESNAGAGANGGSGGGGSGTSGGVAGSTTAGGTGTAGQGNNGGSQLTANRSAAGGGGAGAVGQNGSVSGGNGGNGLASSISGSSVTYAGGGGGGMYFGGVGGSGGTGGGGAGGNTTAAGTAGTANLGGGAGGGGNSFGAGANGGSGIVIISYASATPRFVGGTITTSGGNQIHTFTSSGTLSPITPITASYLVVAGGGSGASNNAGGGGAGGLLTSSTTLYSGATYIVTIGAGGAGVAYNNVGNSGSNSVLSGTGLTTLTAIGGGNGGLGIGSPAGTGGSGGGGGFNAGGGAAGTSGQGNAGGNGSSDSATYTTGGGGGGAGGAGANATISSGGNGGVGISSSISGTATFYAGGGGGCGDSRGSKPGGTGGNGGGGNGGFNGSSTPGTINTGGGSGANGFSSGSSQNGGSGIVIISYAGSQLFNGGLVTSSGGNTIHTFTSTGALTPLTNNLTNSLRFRSSAMASLSRTPAISGNRKTWTWSGWVKRGTLGVAQNLFEAATNSANTTIFYIDGNNNIALQGGSFNLVTTQVFRDPSAWYHIVLAVDTTQATAANRAKIYINGSQVTAFNSSTYETQNTDTFVNNTISHAIGRRPFDTTLPFDGYMADINFIDGQALEPYYFGNNDANGVWKPIQYKGTYGTNGFYLNFADTSALTTSSNAGLGKDTSGNGNYWTTNNISITSGSTYDAMTDVPTNTSATVANYATFNPLWTPAPNVPSNGNLTIGNNNYSLATMLFPTTGKYYIEYFVNNYVAASQIQIGFAIPGGSGWTSDNTWYQNGLVFKNGVNQGTIGQTFTTNDKLAIAVDVDNTTAYFYKNNTLSHTLTGITNILSCAFLAYASVTNTIVSANFGQQPWFYTPPTNYVALNTFNLPTPTILQGNKYFDSTLYSGNNVGQVVVNQGQFRPDFLWIKVRTNTYDHTLADSVRGVSAFLASNTTAAEGTNSELTSFNSNGFTLGATGSMARNVSGQNYVGWQWQSGQGSTSTNTSGSITSTVSVNTTAGFSIISWTSTGSNGTIGHGLGVAPVFIIARRRNTAENWIVYHKNMGGNNGYLLLNGTGAFATGVAPWNSTDPTSSVISINNSAMGAGTSNPMITYAWAEIAGFSRFASYTGNGSTNGPFIYLGFRPKYLLIKCTSTAEQWAIKDTSLVPYNTNNTQFFANAADAETTDNTYHMTDFLSNGFKIRGAAQNLVNGNGQTYIYAAFAENPFKNANAR